MKIVNIHAAKTHLSALVEQLLPVKRSSSPKPASQWLG